ncbi:hypothetical protein TWF106_008986 [Orbilia oligospora]|nr:hypothetical protein TWF106_008986 [Orbilia oligospora]KAF3222356.1 hypothetical protein TWF679_005834 [Orbilia oligospora]KAF3253475.1 hypothetical protein TWF192_003726 [Orbilia oligospora]
MHLLNSFRAVVLSIILVHRVKSQAFDTPNSASHPLRIWTNSAGSYFNDSYLIGNGRIGAALPGGAASEVIRVNEDSLWSGGKLSRVNPDANGKMRDIQSLLTQQRNLEAARLAGFAYAGTPVSARHYEPLGDLQLVMNHSGSTTGYERWLDLSDSSAGVYYAVGGVSYRREYIASNPDNIIAIHITASKPASVSFNIHLRKGQSLNRWEDYAYKVGSDTTVMGGESQGKDGVEFSAGAKVVASGGKVYTLGDYVICDNADEATIFFTAWTAYRQQGPINKVLSDLSSISVRSYSDIRATHVADYQKYSGRVSLSLGGSSDAQKALSTPKRLAAIASTFDPELVALYFQLGRYLFISSSRVNTLPPNLQGIWNQEMDPQWGSKYTVNINLQMNYWPSLVTNMIELTTPLYDLIERLHSSGKKTAQSMYGNSKGWVCHHNTDIWADTAPQDNYASSTWWPAGSAWLVHHIIEEYRFTRDKEFLQKYYNTIKDAALFFTEFLTDYKGWKVTNPTLSPENTFYLLGTKTTTAITLGSTLDNSLIWELFGSLLEIMDILGKHDKSMKSTLYDLRAKLPPLRINKWGGIMEWIEDYDEADPGHRHISHLFGVYPGSEITSTNMTVFNAARSSVSRRLSYGSGSTGWSRAWFIAVGGRLYLPDQVHQSTVALLYNYTHFNSMLNTGPPSAFQIDGNFGGTAGIVEALLHSHETVTATSITTANMKASGTGDATGIPVIRFLPTLPHQWASNGGGFVMGLRARGGAQVDIFWTEDGNLDNATITSTTGGLLWVTLGTEKIGANDGPQISIDGIGSGTWIRLIPKKGTKYIVRLK